MQSRDITEILNKINEMRAVFVLGQRAVPFLEEVFFFLKEISPLIDEINSSIRDSTATMPRATSQLQSVSEATELATTEIMDLVDAVLGQLAPLKQRLHRTSSGLSEVEAAATAIASAVRTAFATAGLDLPPEVDRTLEAHQETIAAARLEVGEDTVAIEEIRSRVNRIMISLQVQDITAQQISSVNHLIESIRSRMTALVERLGQNSPLPTEDIWPIYAGTDFDPNARYDRDTGRQSMIDRVLAGEGPASPVSTPTRPPEPRQPDRTVSAAPAASAPPSDGPASQAEIDALFQNGFA